MKNLKLKFLLVVSLGFNLVIVACGSKKIPRFDAPIYTFDETTCDFRYKYDVDVIHCTDPKAKGMFALTEAGAEKFMETYIGGCMKWDPSLPLIDGKNQLKEVQAK